MKDLIDNKSESELLNSMLAEIAKSSNEISCARADITKAQSRLQFLVVLANKLIDRKKD